MTTKKIITLLAICMTSIMFGLEISSVPVILPSLEKIMQGSFSEIQWIMNAYTIACTVVLMATGSLADRFGRKKLYLISITLFCTTSLACGMAGNINLLIISRFFQGIGGGAMLICQIAVLAQQFRESKERAFAFSLWGIVFGAGLGFGPIIGGALISAFSWKWVFLIHAPISLIALLFVFTGVQESSDPNAQRLDLPGIILLSLTVFGLTFYISQGPDIGFVSVTGVCVVSLTVIGFVLFLRAEKKSSYPMFDFSVFRINSFSGALLGSMGMNFSFWPFMMYFPIYFQHVLGYDPVTTGLYLMAYTLPTLIVPPLAERLSLKYSPGRIIPAGMFIIGLGFFWMRYSTGLDQSSGLTVLPGALMAGAGLGLTNTPVTNTATSSLPESRSGMASGIDMSARLITLAINISLMGFILMEGIYASLKVGSLHHDPKDLYMLSKKIAAGSVTTTEPSIRLALIHGFEWVMQYAAIGIWILAAISFKIFSRNKSVSINAATELQR